MKANYYIDFSAIEGGEDMPLHAALLKAYQVLHGAFGNSGGKYAVAFPEAKNGAVRRSVGGVIRVFAESSADIYQLLEKVRGHHVMRDYVRMSAVKDVPVDFAGEWVSWQRVRVQRRDGVNRTKTVDRAAKTPFFEIRSSAGHVFALRIAAIKSRPQTTDFTPNSYGLASGGNRAGIGCNAFSLPVL